jgi:hypothetical protein
MRFSWNQSASSRFHFIVAHGLVERIGCDEIDALDDPAAEFGNRRVARVPPERDRAQQPKLLTQILQQEGSIPSRETMLFDIQSKVRLHKATPSTSVQLPVS